MLPRTLAVHLLGTGLASKATGYTAGVSER
jgi:hypothetical protein